MNLPAPPVESIAPRPSCAGEPSRGSQPLSLIPFFRRWQPSLLRDLIYTAIWNTLFAVAFTALAVLFNDRIGIGEAFWINFVFAQCIGYPIHLGYIIGDRLLPDINQRGTIVRGAYYSGVAMAGVFVGFLLASALFGHGYLPTWLFSVRGAGSIVVVSLIISGVLLLIFLPRERAARAEAAMAREQARVAAAERAATLAQMKLLEAQVEPHFLYNTLAHVVSLIDAEPATARRMLDRLIVLLRATASAATGAATLGGQLELVRAYLDIIALRMGPRLAWNVDVPTELDALPLPPALLQPIVENAVKHGLEPKLDGGSVTIGARREERTLTLTVADTGLGFRAMRGQGSTGLGLPNLRARLATLYGNAARLTIEDNAPMGSRVTLVIPLP